MNRPAGLVHADAGGRQITVSRVLAVLLLAPGMGMVALDEVGEVQTVVTWAR